MGVAAAAGEGGGGGGGERAGSGVDYSRDFLHYTAPREICLGGLDGRLSRRWKGWGLWLGMVLRGYPGR